MIYNILEYLEANAQRLPDKVAFYDDKEKLTYAQLLKVSKSIGTALTAVSPMRTPVAALMDGRSIKNVSAFLGIVYGMSILSFEFLAFGLLLLIAYYSFPLKGRPWVLLTFSVLFVYLNSVTELNLIELFTKPKLPEIKILIPLGALLLTVLTEASAPSGRS